jgi:tetratricopeptide (TPR) repeat protein
MRAPPPSFLARSAALLAVILILSPTPFLHPIADAFRAAQAATERQDYITAAHALKDAVDRLPYSGYVAYRAGLADISAKQFDAAARLLQISAALDGWTPTKHVALGDAYFGLNRRDDALQQWERALKDLPDDDGLLARLANNYEAAGRYPEAMAALKTLAHLRVDDAAVYYRLALLTAAAAPDEATTYLTLAAGLSPDLAPTADYLRESIELGQSTGDAAYTFGRVGFAFVQMQEWTLAELAFARAIEHDPDYADAHNYLGLVLDRLGRDGLAEYEAALRLAPDAPLTHFFLGQHWRQKGDTAQAIAYLQRAQTLDSHNPAIAAELGAAYTQAGDLPNAEIWYVNAVKSDENNPQFWFLLAQFYTDNNYHVAELGLPAARMAVSLAEESAAAADVLGYALVLTDDLVNGQKMLERALTLDPRLPGAHYHLGLLYARQGKLADAELAFNTVLALDPNGPYGNLALRALAQYAP